MKLSGQKMDAEELEPEMRRTSGNGSGSTTPQESQRIVRLLDPLNNHGLIQKIHNPDVLKRCLELLAELREQIEESGFNLEDDKAILEKIYGDRDENRLRDDLYDSYQIWLVTSMASEEERARERYASPEQCRKNIIEEIEEEIASNAPSIAR